MIHPNTEVKFINEIIGYGVVAKEFIPAGTITWVLDQFDQEFTQEEYNKLDSTHQNILETYSFRNRFGNYILCWDHGRFVNHSFKSNCLTTSYDFEIAIKDIQIGEQLTDDYGYLNIEKPFRGINEGTKRKYVYPDDLLKYHKIWDKKIINVFEKIPTVNQHLDDLIPEYTKNIIKDICNGQKEMESILSNYYSNENQKLATQ